MNVSLFCCRLFIIIISILGNAVYSQSVDISDLKKLSLDELININITTVSKQSEKLVNTPSAVQVITNDDIKRAGVSTLPEAIRLASNLEVAQFNSHDWAITARGFNGAPLSNSSLANKLLVMIDGRSVYTPLFGGVFWDIQNVLLENIDRIEVVSGPGGTLWGTNAVNGVINVVRKKARDTQGFLLSAQVGSFHKNSGSVRYGGKLAPNIFFRVNAQRFELGDTRLVTDDVNAQDSWNMAQGGFRLDYQLPKKSFTVMGDFYDGDEDEGDVTSISGQNLLCRYTHQYNEESDFIIQIYADRTWRHIRSTGFKEDLRTIDIDLQHKFTILKNSGVIWGVGYRFMYDDPNQSFSPAQRNMEIFSTFVQGEFPLIDKKLELTIGTKLEHNDFSGLEVQPSTRITWTPDKKQTIWSAVSRAVRSPSRFDTEFYTPNFIPNKNFVSEKALVYEAGYRFTPINIFSLALAAYYNKYTDLRSLNFVTTNPEIYTFANDQEGENWGLEFSGFFQPSNNWRLRFGYSYLNQNLSYSSNAVFPGSDLFEAIDPNNQFQLQSFWDISKKLNSSLIFRYTESLPTSALTRSVPAYFALDAQIGWKISNIEINLMGQNLLYEHHLEFGNRSIPRSISGKISWGL